MKLSMETETDCKKKSFDIDLLTILIYFALKGDQANKFISGFPTELLIERRKSFNLHQQANENSSPFGLFTIRIQVIFFTDSSFFSIHNSLSQLSQLAFHVVVKIRFSFMMFVQRVVR